MSNILEIDVDNTPFEQVIDNLLDNDRYLEALIADEDYSSNFIDQIFTALGMTKGFYEGVSLGHTIATYSNWTHFDAESGYSIWKYPVTNFKDNATNQMFLTGPDSDDAVLLDYEGEADVESETWFTNVFRYDTTEATPAYVDLTAEAQNEGSSSEFLSDTGDYLYIGFTSEFDKMVFELGTLGTGLDISSGVEYWQNSATPAWASVSDLVDGTSDFSQNGTIEFTQPVDWIQNTINGETLYWIRIDTSGTVGAPYFKTISRGDAVADLLLMTGDEVQDEQWKWCYYNNYIYVAIKNTAKSAYEGNVYIASTSSDANKRNFFITNHEYTVDYEKLSYDTGLGATWTDELVIDLTAKTDATANDFIRLLPGNGLTVAELRLGWNNADAVTTELQINRLNSDATPSYEAADLRINDLYCVNVNASGNVLSGDLKFNNGMAFTEDGDELVLKNKSGKEIFRITDSGDMKISGKIL